MTPREVWEKALACHASFDIDGYARTFAEDGVMELPFHPPGIPWRFEGRAAILRDLGPLWRRTQATGRRIGARERVVVHETRDPEVAVIEFDVTGEDGSGVPFRLSYVHVVRARGGEIVHLRDYVDTWAIGARLEAMKG